VNCAVEKEKREKIWQRKDTEIRAALAGSERTVVDVEFIRLTADVCCIFAVTPPSLRRSFFFWCSFKSADLLASIR